MVQTKIVVAVLHALLSFGALWILIVCFWRTQRLDALRDKLFDFRYELFALAEAKEISFKHPAYCMLRAQLNRMLSRAHRMTGLMLLVKPPQRIENPRQRWAESLTTVPEETRHKLESIEARMKSVVIRHIVVGSPMTILILVCGIIGMMIQRKGRPPQQRHRIIADEVERSIEVLDRIPDEKDALTAVG